MTTQQEFSPSTLVMEIRRPISLNDRTVFVVLLGLIALAILVLLIARPERSGMFLEYDIKFVPAFLDNGIAAIFDGQLLGDPRTRIVANFFGYLNVIVRAKLLAISAIPPALGVAWLLYPLTLLIFGAAVRRIGQSWRAGMVAVVLLASAPAMLDFFVNYYIPAKPLALFFFVLALYGGSLFVANADSKAKPILGSCILAATQFLGLLCDETAVFIGLCMPIIFSGELMARNFWDRKRLAFFSGLFVGVVLYIIFAAFVLPAINHALGQAPIDLASLVSNGVYRTMFGADTTSLSSLIKGYSPAGMAKTIIGAHLFPLTKALVVWTWDRAPTWNIIQYSYLFVMAWAAFDILARLDRHSLFLTGSILLAFVVFILAEAFLILRLSSHITEVNYYANFTSPLMALLIAIPLSAWSQSSDERASPITSRVRRVLYECAPSLARKLKGNRTKQLETPSVRKTRSILVWIVVAAVSSIQFTNFLFTANQHPMFIHDVNPVSWAKLREVYAWARRGTFSDWAERHPYPGRPFIWGLEAALDDHHRRGGQADLKPFSLNRHTPLAALDFSKLFDTQISSIDHPDLKDRTELERAGAERQSPGLVPELLRSGTQLRGQVDGWGLTWRENEKQQIQQYAWQYGLMRIWYSIGSLDQVGSAVCPRFKDSPPCFRDIYRLRNFLFATDDSGKTVIVLRIEQTQKDPDSAPIAPTITAPR
jgi:hypothetical protein